MREKYVKIKNLTVAESLLNFINKELLTQTKIKKEVFWNGFDKYAHDKSIVILDAGCGTGLVGLELLKQGFEPATAISPFSSVSNESKIGKGTIVMHGSIINPKSKIGKNCIINTGCIIEHEVVIEDHCHISTGAILNGGVLVKAGSFIGSGSIIIQNKTIGKNSIIPMGSIIKK